MKTRKTIPQGYAAPVALFARCTVEGPADDWDLVQQLHAAGMTAAAWKVESLIHKAEELEEDACLLSEQERLDLVGYARDLTEDTGKHAESLNSLQSALSRALDLDDYDALYAAVEKALDLVDEIETAAQDIVQQTDGIFNALDV